MAFVWKTMITTEIFHEVCSSFNSNQTYCFQPWYSVLVNNNTINQMIYFRLLTLHFKRHCSENYFILQNSSEQFQWKHFTAEKNSPGDKGQNNNFQFRLIFPVARSDEQYLEWLLGIETSRMPAGRTINLPSFSPGKMSFLETDSIKTQLMLNRTHGHLILHFTLHCIAIQHTNNGHVISATSFSVPISANIFVRKFNFRFLHQKEKVWTNYFDG